MVKNLKLGDDEITVGFVASALASGIARLEADKDHGKVKHNVIACQTARELLTVLAAAASAEETE